VVSLYNIEDDIIPRFHHSGCLSGESYRLQSIWSWTTKEQNVNACVVFLFYFVKLNFNGPTMSIMRFISITWIIRILHNCTKNTHIFITNNIVCIFRTYGIKHLNYSHLLSKDYNHPSYTVHEPPFLLSPSSAIWQLTCNSYTFNTK